MIIPVHLYNNTIEIEFNEDGHTYYLGDKRLPGATTILSVVAKPALIPWAAKTTAAYIADKIQPGHSYDELELYEIFEAGKKAHVNFKQSAGMAGTLVHDFIERYIKGENPEMPVSEELCRSINKFLKWTEEYNVKFLASEAMVYSQKYGYTGTLDFIAKINGELVLGDVKTSSGVWEEYFFQTMAYQIARQEEFPQEKYAYRGIIHIDRKVGSFHWVVTKPEDEERHKKGFLAAKELYDVLEEMKASQR